MSDSQSEKTEQPTPRRLEEAWKKGQFARSAEIQTVFVLLAALTAMFFSGAEAWHCLVRTMTSVLGHLDQVSVTLNAIQGYALNGSLILAQCTWPVAAACTVGGLLAGGFQSRFHTASEALTADWERVNPVSGFQRLFSMRSAAPTGVAFLKLALILALSYSTIRSVLADPIFYSAVDVIHIAGFLAESAFKIMLRVGLALLVVAAIDYGYQLWRNNRDMMMSKEDVQEEAKSSEGNQQVRTAQRKRRQAMTKRKMLLEVPKADVVVTNPTHLAVALRYDRKTMRAPKVVAKGSRLNALRIREIAQAHQVPIVENKPLARLMFKYGKVGGEIPAQLYNAVAEILAYVYRINAYRYYREQNLAVT